MPYRVPWTVKTKGHPGSTAKEIQDEPDWSGGHEHRVGFKNRSNRRPGLTDESERDAPALGADEAEREFERKAEQDLKELQKKQQRGELLSFRDIILREKDFHLRNPQNRSIGWRYVLECTEDWVKNEEDWPANIKRRKKEEEGKSKKDGTSKTQDGRSDQNSDSDQSQEENDWRRQRGEDSKHHDAYKTEKSEQDSDEEAKSEYERLSERYSQQEIALLQALKHEKDYMNQLKENDGKGRSPQTHNRTTIAIDEQDQFSPDNWLPRSDSLIRLTGKHPLNAEADLTTLFEGGLITPNELHYVRNHGAVPRLLWELHTIDVENGKLVLSMDDLKSKFDSVNIPVSLACDGNRRKELNMIKKSKGFNWGAGATGCVYWRGALLRDVLLAAGVKEGQYTNGAGKPRWVNFEGADEPSEGKYATCIPLAYAMDPTNDVLLAYEMNDVPLPPDHGYPVRVMIPGYVGGRCVKWVKRIWTSDDENTSYYHIWDNRVLPSFITEKDGDFATTMFNHPDTRCDEQNLNSVIVRPAQSETLPLTAAKPEQSYRIQGYAYDGGGHEVQRVEVSLDDGATWLYCIRQYPDRPIRHGKKFWTWLHWHVDVGVVHLLQARSISVRAWNVFKNTQPREPTWNTMGMMNNCWYVVKPEIQSSEKGQEAQIIFRHPVVPGTGEGGHLKPSIENRIASAKQAASAPQKQFTREEIEKHDKEDDCWLVIDGKVYDSTSVLKWHPGGKAAILGHAGKVHQGTSDEFASIHDSFAYQKLEECALGVVTEKAANYIKAEAEAARKEKANSKKNGDQDVVLQKHKWVPVKLKKRDEVSEDTRRYIFELPNGKRDLGLGTCQHIQIGFHLKDKMLIRSYTPTQPLLPDPRKNDQKPAQEANGEIDTQRDAMRDGQGTFELLVKTYFPDGEQPGGAMSNILDCIPEGEEVEIRGPTGDIVYEGKGKFKIQDKDFTFNKVSLVLGGSGITPGYALIARTILGTGENMEVRVLDANKSERDILLHDELDHLVGESNGRLEVTHVLSHPGKEWAGKKGHVDADMIRDCLFAPSEESAVFLCGPPAMIQKAALPALKDWGYKEDENMFGF